MATILRGSRKNELESYAEEIGARFHIYPRSSGWELNGSDFEFRKMIADKFPDAIIERGSPEYPGVVYLN